MNRPLLVLSVLALLIPEVCLAASPGAFMRKGPSGERVPFDGFLDRMESNGIMATLQKSGAVSHDQKLQIIRMSYDLLEAYASSAVSDLSFELTDFELVSVEEFPHVPYTDIMTMPGGLMIDAIRTRHTEIHTGVRTVQYVPKWVEGEAEPMKLADGRLLEAASVSAVIQEWDFLQEAEMTVAEIITYQVTSRLRGESRTYQAAFVWFDSGKRETIDFQAMDHIAQGVAEALRESEPPIYDLREEDDGELRRIRLKGACKKIGPIGSVVEPQKKVSSGYHYGADSNHFRVCGRGRSHRHSGFLSHRWET